MKKIRRFCLLTLGLAVFFISACPISFEMPEKIRVVAKPGIAVSLPELEETASQLFGGAISDAFADMEDTAVYAWQNEELEDIQTYLLHYRLEPIAFDAPSADAIQTYDLDQDGEDLELFEIQSMAAALTLDTFSIPPGSQMIPIPENRVYFTLDLGENIRNVKIGAGPAGERSYLELGDAGGNYGKVHIRVGQNGGELMRDGRKFDLTGVTISTSGAATPTRLYIDGQVPASAFSSAGIKIQFGIQNFEEITAVIEKRRLKDNAISLESLPQGTNYITFREIGFGFRAEFTRGRIGGRGNPAPLDGVQIKDLVIDMEAPELGITAGGAGKLVTEPGVPGKDLVEDMRFSTAHILHFAGDVPQPASGYSVHSLKPGARKINMRGAIYSEDEVTIYNLPPGPYELGIRVIPAVISDWENIHVNLEKFMEGNANAGLSGSFLKGKELALNSLFGSSDDEMKNVNFDRMDLYLYIGGDRDKLEGSAIKLTAAYGTREETLTNPADGGYAPFAGITASGGIPDFAGLPAGEEGAIKAYAGKLEPAQLELTNNELTGIFNQWPEDLQMEYDIRLASDFEFLREDLDNGAETPAAINLTPELVIVFPLRLRLLAPEDDTGAPPEGKLTLGGVFPEGDFLKRKTDDDAIDAYIRQLTYLTMDIDYTNTIGLDRASVYLVSRGENPEDPDKWEKAITLVESADTQHRFTLDFSADELRYPFTPELEIRVPAEHGEDGQRYGLIEIKRGSGEIPAGFTARVSVKAAAEINQEIDL